MAIPAKNAFLEAPSRLIHVHLKIIYAQRVIGGLKNAESAIYWRYLSLSFIGFLFFKCEYLNFAEKNGIPN